MPGAPLAFSTTTTEIDYEEELSPDYFHISSWLDDFRSCTSRTRLIPLSNSFISSLLANTLRTADTPTQIQWSDGTIDTEVETTSETADETELVIKEAIETLSGAVSPKIDTVAPTDATWANFHRSTKCTSVADVYTLLSSSERVLESVSSDRPATLVLRQWADFDDRLEYRVFVRDGGVIAACPRANETAEISQDTMDQHMDSLIRWVTQVAIPRMGNTFVVDLYLERGNRVWLVDFAKWGSPTDPMLFQWDELYEAPWLTTGYPQMRNVVTDSIRINGGEVGLPVELRGQDGMRRMVEAARRMYQEQDNQTDDEDSEDEA